MTMYRDEDLLQLSGLQHFAFCRRQWALIYVEGQWQENLRTVEGGLLHRRAHDEAARERRGDTLILRGLAVVSHTLGLTGQVRRGGISRRPAGRAPARRGGTVAPLSRGIQARQAQGAPCRRIAAVRAGHVPGGDALLRCAIGRAVLRRAAAAHGGGVFCRSCVRAVRDACEEMRQYARRGYTPKARPGKHCNACSLKDLCLPQLTRRGSVAGYLQRAMEEQP